MCDLYLNKAGEGEQVLSYTFIMNTERLNVNKVSSVKPLLQKRITGDAVLVTTVSVHG